MNEKMCSRSNLPTRTILLKSPDSNKVREVIITEIVVPDSTSKKLSFVNKMDCLSAKQIRKRRLDHLSLEEKILRKKLKNREAAQTSRDRKKARMDELEATVKRLTQENERLCEDALSLRDERDTLAKENASLHEELWRLRVEGATTAGPAASSHPLPKGTLAPSACHFPLPANPSLQTKLNLKRSPALPLIPQMFLLLLCQIYSTSTGSPSAVIPTSKNWRILPTRCIKKPCPLSNQKYKKKPWWGRYQKAWNPRDRKKSLEYQSLLKTLMSV